MDGSRPDRRGEPLLLRTVSSRFHPEVPGIRRWRAPSPSGLLVVASFGPGPTLGLRDVAEMLSDLSEMLGHGPVLAPPDDPRRDLVDRRVLLVEDDGYGLVTVLYQPLEEVP